MATGLELARRGRLRVWLHSDAPATRGAQAFMFLGAMLCGAALAGLLFVGVWRHTAGEAARSQAAQADVQRSLSTSRRKNSVLAATIAEQKALLATATHGRATARAALSRARAALAQATGALDQAKAALANTKAADGTALAASTARAAALRTDASKLASATAALRSELTALEGYTQNPGPAGIDPGYLATQMRYLDASAAAASTAASDLAQRAG